MNAKKDFQEDFLVQLKPNKEQLETLKKVNQNYLNILKYFSFLFQVCAHVGLYIGLIAYTAIGAKVSRYDD